MRRIHAVNRRKRVILQRPFIGKQIPMQKFLVLYMAPPAVLEEWAKTDPEKRKEAEGKMQADWKKWMTDHKDALGETAGAGKTKMVTKDGVTDTKNDVMLFSMLE